MRQCLTATDYASESFAQRMFWLPSPLLGRGAGGEGELQTGLSLRSPLTPDHSPQRGRGES